MKLSGGCHCGAVRFEIVVEEPVELLICNCSICAMTGFEHLIVPRAGFELLNGREALTSYRFGTGQAEHLFCGHCGVKSFYRPRSHPGSLSVDFRCLDRAHGILPTRREFDGRDWERAREEFG